MRKLTAEEVEGYRERSFRRHPELVVTTEEEARQFIDEVGFCFLFPVATAELPNLWDAINGRGRPIPHHHHDPALRKAWAWKDTLPTKKLAFYAKFLRGKPTFISLEMFPCFYALSDNYGELDDYLEAYEMGKMSEEAKRIYEVLLDRGACPTGQLRREAGLWGFENSPRFERALRELQAGLRIAKCGISDANRWKYSYVYDLLPRCFPQEVTRGLEMGSREALPAIILKYLKTVLVSSPQRIAHLFNWPVERTERVVGSLLSQGLLEEAEIAGERGVLLA